MVQASRRKYHYIYKTTCSITGKFYIGMHSTDDLNDGYVGSGKILWHSIRKHGKENHHTEILEYLQSREELKLREAQLVNHELLNNSLCINLKLGGEGGWEYHNKDSAYKQARVNGAIAANKSESKRKKASESGTKVWKARHAAGLHDYATFTGKKHTEDTVKRMKEAKVGTGIGDANSQFGTCWIYSIELQLSQKVQKEFLQSYLDDGWIKGRKIFKKKCTHPQVRVIIAS